MRKPDGVGDVGGIVRVAVGDAADVGSPAPGGSAWDVGGAFADGVGDGVLGEGLVGVVAPLPELADQSL